MNPEAAALKEAAQSLIRRHAERAARLEDLFETATRMAEAVGGERERVGGALADLLARHCSLRRADFSRIVAPLLDRHTRRAETVKTLTRAFLARQRELSGQLADALECGDLGRARRAEQALARELDETVAHVTALHAEQEHLRERLGRLTALRERLTLAELKGALAELGHEPLAETASASAQPRPAAIAAGA